MSSKKFTQSSLHKLQNINFHSVWVDIKEAIAGTERDFTNTPLGKSIFILAVPMVLEMIMELLVNQVKIHEVRDGVEHIAVVGHNVPHTEFNFGVGVRDHHKHFVQLYANHLRLAHDRLSFVHLHLQVFQSVLLWGFVI